jgi:histone H3/H4
MSNRSTPPQIIARETMASGALGGKAAAKVRHAESMSLPMGEFKRHKTQRKPVRTEKCLKKASMRNLFRRGGVVKMGGDCYDGGRTFLESVVRDVLKDANAYRRYCKHKTITTHGVKLAFARKGFLFLGAPTAPHRKKAAAASARKSAAAILRIAAARASME